MHSLGEENEEDIVNRTIDTYKWFRGDVTQNVEQSLSLAPILTY